jgi:hypothetical protein
MKYAKLLLYIVFVAVFIVAFYVVLTSYRCVLLKIVPLPRVAADHTGKNHDLVILREGSLCGTCANGRFISGLSARDDVVYFVPFTYSADDVDNLRFAFDIQGMIARADGKGEDILSKIHRCSKYRNAKGDVYLRLDKNNRIREIRFF